MPPSCPHYTFDALQPTRQGSMSLAEEAEESLYLGSLPRGCAVADEDEQQEKTKPSGATRLSRTF